MIERKDNRRSKRAKGERSGSACSFIRSHQKDFTAGSAIPVAAATALKSLPCCSMALSRRSRSASDRSRSVRCPPTLADPGGGDGAPERSRSRSSRSLRLSAAAEAERGWLEKPEGSPPPPPPTEPSAALLPGPRSEAREPRPRRPSPRLVFSRAAAASAAFSCRASAVGAARPRPAGMSSCSSDVEPK